MSKATIPTIVNSLVRGRKIDDDLILDVCTEVAGDNDNVTFEGLKAYAAKLAEETIDTKASRLFDEAAGADGKLTLKEMRQSFELKAKDLRTLMDCSDATTKLGGPDNILTKEEFLSGFKKFVLCTLDIEIAELKLRDSDQNGVITMAEMERFLRTAA
mmetsp:Transcript_65215/g.175065  ORF Transcript_65215/g.175065 Transcript_65215/m.175065 type:complete len:158 (-) Transcript_65215:86-559(-)